MITRRNWKALHTFEAKQKEIFLKNLTEVKSLDIFRELCEFVHDLGSRNGYHELRLRKIKNIQASRRLLMKIKP